MIVYRRRINMVPGEVPVFLHLSQYDSDVVLEFELYASEGTFVVESGTTALIRGTKPDGNGISIDADVETEGGVTTVTVEVIQQMTAVAGKSLYELSLRYDGEELNTANFVLDIERAPLDAETLPSESVIKELADTLTQADEILEAAEIVRTAYTFSDPNSDGHIVITVGGDS